MEPWKRTLYILFVGQAISAVGFAVFFPFLPLYVADLGTNTGLSLEFWAGMVFAGQALTMAIASPFWGTLADRYGRKPMIERAMFGGAIIILLMGFARSAEELALLRAIQGVITGTISAANALAASTVPRHRMGYAMGMLQVAMWGGVAIGPLIGGLIADTFGFRAAFIATAVLLLIAWVIVRVGVHETFTPPDPSIRRPGLLAAWRIMLGRSGVAVAYLVRFLSWLGPTMLIPILPLFIQSILHGSERISTFTGLVVGISSATGTASALFLGRFGDRRGHRRVLIGSGLVAALFFLPQGFVTEGWQLLVLQAITGAATGGMGPALSALLAQYTPPGEEGVVYGLDNSVSAASRAAAPLLGAGIAIWFGPAGIFFAAGLILSCTVALVALFLRDRPPQPVVTTPSRP
ncbi:MAG TPA: MFS transporter [Roseiflexaceae bacterium]|nr:MFS transporter [Roseiflexaceae bacterium]